MKKSFVLFALVAAATINYQCSKTPAAPDLNSIKLDLPLVAFNYGSSETPKGKTFVPYENGNTVNNDKATIGRVLFYDKALSLHNNVACASCHLQKNAFSDVVDFSDGFNGEKTLRNSMGINNLFEERNIGYFWDIRETKIESMVLKPVANHIEMGFEKAELLPEKINHLPYYKGLFKMAYGDETATKRRIEESLGHFLFSLVSNKSKFDIGAANNFSNFTQEEYSGKNLFISNGCNTCHLVAPNTIPTGYYQQFPFGSMANTGLKKKDNDLGKEGLYKIPRLKNVALTAPYMHDGSIATLEEVIDHYSTGIQDNPKLSTPLRTGSQPRKFNFTDTEKAKLVAFLKTMTDENLPTDPKFSSPFKP